MLLYFIRHAETGTVEDEQRPEDDLSPMGIKQAQALSERLSRADIQAIYSSPYQRAISTARVLMKEFPDLSMQVDQRLREIPLWVSPASLRGDSPQEYRKEHAVLNKAREHLLEFIKEIKTKYGKTPKDHPVVAVITHGNLIRATVGLLLEMPLNSIVRLSVDHTSISVFEWVADPVSPFFLLRRFNDTAHLEI